MLGFLDRQRCPILPLTCAARLGVALGLLALASACKSGPSGYSCREDGQYGVCSCQRAGGAAAEHCLERYDCCAVYENTAPSPNASTSGVGCDCWNLKAKEACSNRSFQKLVSRPSVCPPRFWE